MVSVVVGPLAGPLLDCSMEWEAGGTSQSSRTYFTSSTSTGSSFFSSSSVFVSASVSASALTSAVSTSFDSDSVSSAAASAFTSSASASVSDSASAASTSFVSSAVSPTVSISASDSASCPSKSRVEETIYLIFLFPSMAAEYENCCPTDPDDPDDRTLRPRLWLPTEKALTLLILLLVRARPKKADAATDEKRMILYLFCFGNKIN
mmetsp:Transcript_8004/g.11909  ORF Transcript_8004/g.11909 Transcript_8004/m.11909 type:complete len:207 (-) Transcript_8004:138-758(-)